MPEQMTLDEIERVATWSSDLPDDDRVYVDPRRGHIRIGQVIIADLGDTLDLWTYSGHRLSPDSADALGAALCAWASRVRARLAVEAAA